MGKSTEKRKPARIVQRASDSKIVVGNSNKAAALLRDVGIQTTEPVAYANDLAGDILSNNPMDVKKNAKTSADVQREKTEKIQQQIEMEKTEQEASQTGTGKNDYKPFSFCERGGTV